MLDHFVITLHLPERLPKVQQLVLKQYYIFLVSSFVDSSGIQCSLNDNGVLVIQVYSTLEIFTEIYTILNIENYNEFIQPLQ